MSIHNQGDIVNVDGRERGSLCIVIVNYRIAALVIDAIVSLVGEIKPHCGDHVVVVDNNSGDGSAEMLRKMIEDRSWSKWCSVKQLGTNGGFAFGNNAAIREALDGDPPPNFILLLNPDTVVRPGAIDAILEVMRSNPDIGVAGARLEHPDGEEQSAAFRFPTIMSEMEGSANLSPVSKLLGRWRVWLESQSQSAPVDWVSGAAMMVRREVFEEIGLLDERYFMYYEELDFCRRARRAGFEIWHVPASRIVHLVGQSSGLTVGPERQKRRPAFWFRSRRWYWVKHHGYLGAAAADLTRIAGTAACRLGLAVRGKPNWMPPRYLRDLVRHSVFVEGFRP
ncbi:MAG: glycosyltransferase family 2 protein [Phycisphaeraceae bacterium]|nr:MAG: glycosyltransferase family 2 protein [Phycisphaeraceae bacterium]